MATPKIILLCSSRLALPALQELAFFNMLVAIIIPRHCDEMIETVRNGLTGSGIPIVEVDKLTYPEQIKDAIETYKANVGLMITFSYKIPAAIYSLPEHGFFNVHPGPLPNYRGADPIFQQIKNREKQAGVTIHFLDESFDTGPIVSKEMIRLLPTDTYGILTSKLAVVAAKLVTVLLKLISLDITIPSKIQDTTKAKYYKRQLVKDVSINWETMDAVAIVALINACNPWNKGATTTIKNRIIRFLEASVLNGPINTQQSRPAELIAINNYGVIVSTINGQFLNVGIIYMDEGFMNLGRLSELGIQPGDTFQSI